MSRVIFVLFSLLMMGPVSVTAQSSEIDYNRVSEDLLNALKDGNETKDYTDIIETSTIDDLADFLDTDDKKFAFWLNIYNSYIILTLQGNEELYEDRKKFFKAPHIKIAGEEVAFSKIEHGIVRRSQWELGLGLIKKPFPGKWERKLRVKKRDYRVHFALNCGAIACPPVTVYDPINLDKQLQFMTDNYLNANTVYEEAENKVTTTPLFSWFRGDFGGKKGVKKILASHEIIPSKKVNLNFKGYDWTLDIDNFVETPYNR